MNAPFELPAGEPDGAVWTDPATGLKCLIRRNRLGAFCGYVRVPHSNLRKRLTKFQRTLVGCGRWRKSGYNHGALRRIQVHGGLTFSGRFYRGTHRGYWLGFDCAHYYDLTPGMPSALQDDGTYRDFGYVTREVESLAAQLKTILDKEQKCR